jgi:hypothetical protein
VVPYSCAPAPTKVPVVIGVEHHGISEQNTHLLCTSTVHVHVICYVYAKVYAVYGLVDLHRLSNRL